MGFSHPSGRIRCCYLRERRPEVPNLLAVLVNSPSISSPACIFKEWIDLNRQKNRSFNLQWGQWHCFGSKDTSRWSCLWILECPLHISQPRFSRRSSAEHCLRANHSNNVGVAVQNGSGCVGNEFLWHAAPSCGDSKIARMDAETLGDQK